MPIQTILTSSQLATMRQRVESETSVKLIYSKGDHYPLPGRRRHGGRVGAAEVNIPRMPV